MWLDSKAVNCPQKWGNFTVTIELIAFHMASPKVALKRNQRRSTPMMVRGLLSAGYPRHAFLRSIRTAKPGS